MDQQTRNNAHDLLRNSLRAVGHLLEDPHVQEVMINGPNNVWVEKAGQGIVKTEVDISDVEIRSSIQLLASLENKEAKERGKESIIDSRLDGFRFAAAMKPTSMQGPSISIRKHNPVHLSLDDYVANGAIPEEMAGVLRKMVQERKNVVVAGGTSSGKAQPLDAQVLTPNGFVPMGSLKVGDAITSPDGMVDRIVGVFPQGEKEVFRITFHDGRAAESCAEHLWQVWSRTSTYVKGSGHNGKKIRGMGWRVLPLSEVIDRFKRKSKLYERSAVPLVSPYAIELPQEAHSIPPYVLGVLIGDGCLVDSTAKFSTADDFILSRLTAELPGYEITPIKGYDYRIAAKVKRMKSEMKTSLEALGLQGMKSNGKFIPDAYKRGTAAQRMALMQGLMDTDGFISKDGAVSYATVSKRLANDVREVVTSLGGIATITEKTTTYRDKNGDKQHGQIAYNVWICHPVPDHLVSLPRKLKLVKPRSRDWRLRIVSIEPIGKKQTQCIKVARPEGLYVTDGYVVTHNTTFVNALIGEVDPGDRVLTIEDTQELKVKVPNWVPLISNEQEGVTTRDLVRLSLRFRPDRIIVGEVRGGEAFDLLDAANTGHDGCLATLHANNCAGALSRFESLVLRAGINWPHEAIKAQIADTFDFVVFMARVKTGRKLAEIMAINGFDFDSKRYITEEVYRLHEKH